jgi:lipoyl(octanoyl) transferase
MASMKTELFPSLASPSGQGLPGVPGVIWETSLQRVAYPDGVAQMDLQVQRIVEGEAPEQVWLLEHDDVYTIGSRGTSEAILTPPTIPVYETGRGGQVTYHGPGQRIGYVLLNLRQRKLDPRTYVQTLQAWIREALKALGIEVETRGDRIGLWVREGAYGLAQESKLVAIGIRIRKGITLHGFAVNVHPDLARFQNIIPCGLTGYGITSCHQLGFSLSLPELDASLYKTFSQFF